MMHILTCPIYVLSTSYLRPIYVLSTSYLRPIYVLSTSYLRPIYVLSTSYLRVAEATRFPMPRLKRGAERPS
jgi:hypothetical protein